MTETACRASRHVVTATGHFLAGNVGTTLAIPQSMTTTTHTASDLVNIRAWAEHCATCRSFRVRTLAADLLALLTAGCDSRRILGIAGERIQDALLGEWDEPSPFFPAPSASAPGAEDVGARDAQKGTPMTTKTAAATIIDAYTVECTVLEAAHAVLAGDASEALAEAVTELATVLRAETDINGELVRGQSSAAIERAEGVVEAAMAARRPTLSGR